MKKICTLLLCAGMLLSAASGANAIDFKAKGQWLVGFALSDTDLIHKYRAADHVKHTNMQDQFHAAQRVRLQLDAVASESLSGTVFFEIGNQRWGQGDTGGALGADSTNVIKLKRAYIDWMVPETELKVRMGIQGIVLPNAAGGSAIMDTDAAGISANYKINDNVSVSALWVRPLNDNFSGYNDDHEKIGTANYLDNMDLFSLMVPISLDGVDVTPWVMYGFKGKNAMKDIEEWEGFHNGFSTNDGNLPYSLYPYPGINNIYNMGGTGKSYGSMIWAGLPISITAFDPLNIELDINYGYVEAMGRYWADKSYERIMKRSSTERQGWLAKALIEYKMDWAVPGIFGWYASGDDGNPKNGSERMPSVVPMGTFTSFLGDGNLGWIWNDYALDYSGTWGIGLQIRDISFIENLSHTFRAAYWGGTNDTGMIKYMNDSYAWNDGWGSATSPYLTTEDGLLEFNLVNNYQMYENFNVNLELGYVANFMSNSAWDKAGNRNTSFSKQDAWKAQLVFEYSF